MRDKYLKWSLIFNVIQAGILVAGIAFGGMVLKDIREDQKAYHDFMIEQAGLNGEFTTYMKLKSE